MKKFIIGLLAVLTVFILSGCADTIPYTMAQNVTQVGFWYGLWHGMILPFSWLVSLFSDNTAIYAVYNNGGWYDFGFMIGSGALVSSSASNTGSYIKRKRR